jgi:hypothetical protein
MKFLMVVIICLLVLMTCSCAKVDEKNPGIVKGRWVHEVMLSDGTRCAVVLRYDHPGGIDCDWKTQEVEAL